MSFSRWAGNPDDPDDRSGVATFYAGESDVSVRLNDVSDFHKLDSIIASIRYQELKAAEQRMKLRIISSLSAFGS